MAYIEVSGSPPTISGELLLSISPTHMGAPDAEQRAWARYAAYEMNRLMAAEPMLHHWYLVSAWRSRRFNATLANSVADSLHVWGSAIDGSPPPGVTPGDFASVLYETARRINSPWCELYAYRRLNTFHIAWGRSYRSSGFR